MMRTMYWNIQPIQNSFFEKWQKLVDIVIDGGYGGNLASTVIDLTTNTPNIIRRGKGEWF